MSRTFSKFLAASKHGAEEVGEFNIDTNELRFYSQEIEVAKNNLAEVKQKLAQIPEKETLCEYKIKQLIQEIERFEIDAATALKNDNYSLADELAEKIAELESQLAIQHTAKSQHAEHAFRLKDLMKKTERNILEHERELAMIKTTDSVQKATKSIEQSYHSGATKPLSAKNALAVISKRQKSTEHRWATEELLEKEFLEKGLTTEAIQSAAIDSSHAKRAALQRIRRRAAK